MARIRMATTSSRRTQRVCFSSKKVTSATFSVSAPSPRASSTRHPRGVCLPHRAHCHWAALLDNADLPRTLGLREGNGHRASFAAMSLPEPVPVARRRSVLPSTQLGVCSSDSETALGEYRDHNLYPGTRSPRPSAAHEARHLHHFSVLAPFTTLMALASTGGKARCSGWGHRALPTSCHWSSAPGNYAIPEAIASPGPADDAPNGLNHQKPLPQQRPRRYWSCPPCAFLNHPWVPSWASLAGGTAVTGVDLVLEQTVPGVARPDRSSATLITSP